MTFEGPRACPLGGLGALSTRAAGGLPVPTSVLLQPLLRVFGRRWPETCPPLGCRELTGQLLASVMDEAAQMQGAPRQVTQGRTGCPTPAPGAWASPIATCFLHSRFRGQVMQRSPRGTPDSWCMWHTAAAQPVAQDDLGNVRLTPQSSAAVTPSPRCGVDSEPPPPRPREASALWPSVPQLGSR